MKSPNEYILGQTNGTETSLTKSNGSVTVDVSECPILVITEPSTECEPELQEMSVSSIVSSGETSGTVRYGSAASVYDGTVPTGSWQSTALAFNGNGTVTLNFSSSSDIDKIEVFTNAGVEDTVNVKVEHYDSTTSSWIVYGESSISSTDKSVVFFNDNPQVQ